MIKKFTLGMAIVALSGCANQGYNEYLNSHTQIETAKANAEAERYRAMAEIAKYGDTTTQVAAMMALQERGEGSKQSNRLSPPVSPAEEVRRWAAILVPSATQIYGSIANRDIAITNSNNNRDVSIANAEQQTATTSAIVNGMVGVAQEIQAPAANYTDSNNSYADSYNADSYNPDSYNTPTDSNNSFADSYNDNSDNSDNSDNTDNTDNSVTDTIQP